MHPRSLISAFVVRCLDSIIPEVSISEISSLYLVPLAVQAGLSLPGRKLPETGFLVTRLNENHCSSISPFNFEQILDVHVHVRFHVPIEFWAVMASFGVL